MASDLDKQLDAMTLPGHIIMTRSLSNGWFDGHRFTKYKTYTLKKNFVKTTHFVLAPDVASAVAERRYAWAYYLYTRPKAIKARKAQPDDMYMCRGCDNFIDYYGDNGVCLDCDMCGNCGCECTEETCVKCNQTKLGDWYYNTTPVKNAPVCADCV